MQLNQAVGQAQQYHGGGHGAHYQCNYEGDGYSARAEAGYPLPQPNQHRSVHSRLGGQALQEGDQRYALDCMQEARLQEEAVPPGPRCFTSRIMNEPKPEGTYQLPRGTKSYDGGTNSDDWLTDYAHAVHIANGNLRWTIRCIPQMLEGPARI